MSTTSAAVYGPALPRYVQDLPPDGGKYHDVATSRDTRLHLAVRSGDVSLVLSLIEDGLDIEALDANGFTAIFVAAEIGNTEVVRLLVERGACVDAKQKRSDWRQELRPQTALRMAAYRGHVEVARILLEHGADVNGRQEGYPPPLEWAVEEEHVAVIRLLLERGADTVVRSEDQLSALHSVMGRPKAQKTLEIVSLLLQFGAAADATDIDGRSVLSLAVSTRHDLATICMLLDHGAQYQASSALHVVAMGASGDDLGIMRLLIERGADITTMDASGWTVLHNVVKYLYHKNNDHEQAEAARLLLHHGADPNWRTKDGLSVLYVAVGNELAETVSLLLEHGAEVAGLVQGVETVLHRAIRIGSPEIVRLLLEKGADRHAHDKDGISAVQLARMYGRKDILRVFGLQPMGLPMIYVLPGDAYIRDDFVGLHDFPANRTPSLTEAWRAIARAHVDRAKDHMDKSQRRLASRQSAESQLSDEDTIAGAVTELNDAIVEYEMANNHDPDGVICSVELMSAYFQRYRLTEDAVDLDMAILSGKEMDITTQGVPRELHELAYMLIHRYKQVSHSPTDLEYAMQIFRTCMFCPESPLIADTCFQAARAYADLCLEYRDAIAAMRPLHIAIDIIMPIIVRPTGRLEERFDSVLTYVRHTLSIAVAAALDAKDVARALEWFERGRCVAWHHVLRFQTPIEEVFSVDPVLAGQIQKVVTQLHAEELIMEESVRHPSDLQSYMRHNRLVDEFEALVAQAGELSGLRGFLSPKTSSELKMAAALGSVVVLNVAENHCDAIILQLDGEDISHVTLPLLLPDNLGRIAASFQECVHATGRHARGFVAARSSAANSMERILLVLWKQVVEPVFKSLDLMSQASDTQRKLPRITWCVSGLLAFLPLHAAGIYSPSQPHSAHKAYEHAVHSYTPSLSVLVDALRRRNLSRVTSATIQPRILAISQPATPGQSPLPGTVDEVAAIRNVVGADTMTWLNGADATKPAVLEHLDHTPWVHFACHAVQNHANPTQSAFMLQDGGLTLHDLMRRTSISVRKELAVLSACQTATGDTKVPEEAVHLAAGMLMTGFRSVVATMWSIDDNDAPVVMETFYEYLLHEAKGDSAQSALALHRATKRLREKVGEKKFMQWVPFIHMGV